MSWTEYNEAIAEIKDVFEADHATAQEIYRDLREDYDRPIYADDIREEIEDVELAEEREELDWEEGQLEDGSTDWDYWHETDYLDDMYFDDDWIDAGEEIEFTIEYEETR